MTGNPPSYDPDHPPPQWPRYYRNDDALENPVTSDVFGYDAPSNQYDNLGPLGKVVPLLFLESTTPGATHTMSEYLPEKHIYIVQYLEGNDDDLVVDDKRVYNWDSFIELLNRIRQQMIDEFNTYVWICYVVYARMNWDEFSETTDRQNATYPAGAPYHEWVQNGFVPSSRAGGSFDLPSFCTVVFGPASDNITNMASHLSTVQGLGGPGLQAGRTALAIVNSYPTYNTADNTGLYDVDWTNPFNPIKTTTYQTFVDDRNSNLTEGSGQTIIDEADTKPSKVDFSGRGSGINVDILAIDSEAYVKGDNITFDTGIGPGGKGGQAGVRNFEQDSTGAAGPLHPQYFPYPHVSKNLWAYWVEPWDTYPVGNLDPPDDDITGVEHPTKGYPFLQDPPPFPLDPLPPLRPTLWRGYRGRDENGYSGSAYSKFFSREGVFEDVDVELDDADPSTIIDITKKNNYDGLVGEIPAFVGVGALAGNPGEAGGSRQARFYPKGAMLAAQVIWRDHMGGEGFKLRCKGVKNLVVTPAADHLDYRADTGAVGVTPVFPGTITRPTVVLTWESAWDTEDGSASPLMPIPATFPTSPEAIDTAAGTPGSGGKTSYSQTSGSGGSTPDYMTLWEVRWAFDAATLKAGGGNRINTLKTTTADTPETDTSFPYPHVGARIPVSHGRSVPTEIFFTVVEYNIKERNADWNGLLGDLGGKIILEPKNSWAIYGWASSLWPYPDAVPSYIGSNVITKFLDNQDFTNVKHLPDDIFVVSAMVGADPEA